MVDSSWTSVNFIFWIFQLDRGELVTRSGPGELIIKFSSVMGYFEPS